MRRAGPTTEPAAAATGREVPKAWKLRGCLAAAALLALLGGLAWRLRALQVVEAAHWRAVAERQQRPIRTIPAHRGTILSRDGTPLAVSIGVRSAYAEPWNMGRVEGKRRLPATPEDIAARGHAIAAALGYDREREEKLVARLLRPSSSRFCWIERRLDDARAARLEEAAIPGTGFKNEYRRVYPDGTLAPHIIGFVGLGGDGDLYGLTGLEAVLEKTLAGVDGLREYVRMGADRHVAPNVGRDRAILEEGRVELAPEDGANVTLTIDANIQRVCRDAAARAGALWQPEGIAVVVIRPEDGRILALVSWPGYDAERPPFVSEAELQALPPEEAIRRRGEVESRLRNRPIMDSFEPGSILKPLVASYAVAKGAVTPTELFDCTSPAHFGARRVTDVHNLGPAVPFSEVISKSSNIGMSRIALALGPDGLAEVVRKCGFGRRTGLGLPLEEPGDTRQVEHRKGQPTTISVAQGYGLMVTPVQMASAFAALGNHGVRMRPQLIERIEDARGRLVRSFKPEEEDRIVDGAIADQVMLPALMKVVEEGTGKNARLEKWTVGGKTGTAMKVIGRGYRVGHYRSSFCCLAPLERPEVCVLVMTDEPKPRGGTPYGGTVSAPIAREILERILPYLRVPPSPPFRTKPVDRGDPAHD
jgi:cell division protein FtsI (penicillin-binding protein 3)